MSNRICSRCHTRRAQRASRRSNRAHQAPTLAQRLDALRWVCAGALTAVAIMSRSNRALFAPVSPTPSSVERDEQAMIAILERTARRIEAGRARWS